jgi:hypothetical protein
VAQVAARDHELGVEALHKSGGAALDRRVVSGSEMQV